MTPLKVRDWEFSFAGGSASAAETLHHYGLSLRVCLQGGWESANPFGAGSWIVAFLRDGWHFTAVL